MPVWASLEFAHGISGVPDRIQAHMRNVFDQYSQPEKKLTHALCCTLLQDRTLLKPFLKRVGVQNIPPVNDLAIVQQHIPGRKADEEEQEKIAAGLPDLMISNTDGWAVVFEMKVTSTLTTAQLNRHRATVVRDGYESPILVAVTVEPPRCDLPDGTLHLLWRDLYSWFAEHRASSTWARSFVEFMEIFEARADRDKYIINGKLTMFDGLRFDEDSPFTYLSAKRLLKNLGEELQANKELQRAIAIDPNGKRRPAITDDGGVWDFIPLAIAKGHDFVRFPHLTIVLREAEGVAAIVVPNGVSGGFRTKLKERGLPGFAEVIQEIEKRLRPVLRRCEDSRAVVHAVQRHYLSQRSKANVDGELKADLRTCVESESSVKYQPQWIESLFNLLVYKRSNVQFGIEVELPYSSSIVRSAKVTDLFVDAWKAMSPLLELVLQEDE
jgi:hypothetical protein